MTKTNIRELLARLQREIRDTELDDDTRSMVRDLDAEIHELLEAGGGVDATESIVEKARELETGFAAEHPTIERFLREVVDALVRMGI